LKPDFKGVLCIYMAWLSRRSLWEARVEREAQRGLHGHQVQSIIFKGKKVKSHVLRIAFKGYETSMAINFGETKGTVKEIREEQPREWWR
jgi:hypothetical protein